jgi:pyruvate formate lyase activating enzyme
VFPEIAGWAKTSFIDYPGVPSVLIFLAGCNLRCPYCHNPGVVNGQYGQVPFDLIRDHIIKRQNVLEGAVISGGEPTLHPWLPDMCGDLMELGLKVKIDTNGLEPGMILDSVPDYVALDIKTAIGKYNLLGVAGKGYRKRLEQSINIAAAMGEMAEVRITAVPGIVNMEDIEALSEDLQGVNSVFIQQFNPDKPMLDPAYSSVKPYGMDALEAMRDILSGAGINCSIRG